MSSKAKSGLSAVRQYAEPFLASFEAGDAVNGALSYSLPTMDGKGHSRIRAGVTNGVASPGKLQILQAWNSAGPFIEVATATTVVDPTSGHQVCDLDIPVTRHFVIIRFWADGAPGVVVGPFELGGYFLPRG